MEKIRYYVDLPPFTGRNVPVGEIARAMGKDAQYIRYGLQKGIFTFGYAVKLCFCVTFDESNKAYGGLNAAPYMLEGGKNNRAVNQRHGRQRLTDS